VRVCVKILRRVLTRFNLKRNKSDKDGDYYMQIFYGKSAEKGISCLLLTEEEKQRLLIDENKLIYEIENDNKAKKQYFLTFVDRTRLLALMVK
jgi:hypothetical protein